MMVPRQLNIYFTWYVIARVKGFAADFDRFRRTEFWRTAEARTTAAHGRERARRALRKGGTATRRGSGQDGGTISQRRRPGQRPALRNKGGTAARRGNLWRWGAVVATAGAAALSQDGGGEEGGTCYASEGDGTCRGNNATSQDGTLSGRRRRARRHALRQGGRVPGHRGAGAATRSGRGPINRPRPRVRPEGLYARDSIPGKITARLTQACGSQQCRAVRLRGAWRCGVAAAGMVMAARRQPS